MTTIYLYRGPAARAALRAITYRRIALRGCDVRQACADMFWSANEFLAARAYHEESSRIGGAR